MSTSNTITTDTDTNTNTITIDKSTDSNNPNTVHITLNTVTSNTKTFETPPKNTDFRKHSTNRYLDDMSHIHGHVQGRPKKLTHSRSGQINTHNHHHNTGKLKVAIANHYKNRSHTDEVDLKLPKSNGSKTNNPCSLRKNKRSNTIHFERRKSNKKSASNSSPQSPNKRENAINALKNKLNRLKKSPARLKQSLPFNSYSKNNLKTPNKSDSSSSLSDDDSDEFRRSQSQTSLKYSSPIVGMSVYLSCTV